MCSVLWVESQPCCRLSAQSAFLLDVLDVESVLPRDWLAEKQVFISQETLSLVCHSAALSFPLLRSDEVLCNVSFFLSLIVQVNKGMPGIH